MNTKHMSFGFKYLSDIDNEVSERYKSKLFNTVGIVVEMSCLHKHTSRGNYRQDLKIVDNSCIMAYNYEKSSKDGVEYISDKEDCKGNWVGIHKSFNGAPTHRQVTIFSKRKDNFPKINAMGDIIFLKNVKFVNEVIPKIECNPEWTSEYFFFSPDGDTENIHPYSCHTHSLSREAQIYGASAISHEINTHTQFLNENQLEKVMVLRNWSSGGFLEMFKYPPNMVKRKDPQSDNLLHSFSAKVVSLLELNKFIAKVDIRTLDDRYHINISLEAIEMLNISIGKVMRFSNVIFGQEESLIPSNSFGVIHLPANYHEYRKLSEIPVDYVESDDFSMDIDICDSLVISSVSEGYPKLSRQYLTHLFKDTTNSDYIYDNPELLTQKSKGMGYSKIFKLRVNVVEVSPIDFKEIV